MKKNLIPLYFVIASAVVGLSIIAAYMARDMTKTVPKIKLSYFKSVPELAETVLNRLELELTTESQFWIGIEPNKSNHIVLAEELTLRLKSLGKIEQVYVDEQLGLSEQQLAGIAMAFPDFKVLTIKEHWFDLSEMQKKNELAKSMIITASIYATSMLPQNPINKIKKDNPNYKPTTFSTGHFAISTEDEKNLTFPCGTEDRAGTQNWACGILNKARAQRRKIQPTGEVHNKTFLGVMDLTGEKDYMIVFTERTL